VTKESSIGYENVGGESNDELLLSCDVCIVGAGIAGLNALFVASRYLTSDQRVVLIDRRKRVGGMWVDTYSYVRLHQPHGMFTAGDIEWTIKQDPAYLATKSEVLDHFAHCVEVVRRSVTVDELYGWTFDDAREGPRDVRISCRNAEGRQLVVVASRLIKAFGADVTPNDPLPLQSTQVHSVSPDSCNILDRDIRNGSAPVWVIGGGKTGMDTAHGLLVDNPGRSVHLLAGDGTYFVDRDKVFPRGGRRWWTGHPVSVMATQLAGRFDGSNETAVAEWHQAEYGLSVGPTAANFKFGLLSPAELSTISAGLDSVVIGHLSDVVDTDAGPVILLRNGTRVAVEPGSWIVNCTGYLLGAKRPYEPYVSPGGRVVTVSMRSSTHFLSSHIAYYLTHLLMLGRIHTTPLYELDGYSLARLSKPAFTAALTSVTLYNQSLLADAVPSKVFSNFRADLDRWFPPHRRLQSMAVFMLTHHRQRPRLRAQLDAVRERFQVACGPLPYTGG
jgi:Pyridine nucleotide-disulphide oxidoreductase